MINRYLAGAGPAVVAATPPTDAAALPSITVTEGALPPTRMALCKSLLRAQTPST
jgi:hypothetical protein